MPKKEPTIQAQQPKQNNVPEGSKNYAIVYQGKSIHRTPYTVNIKVIDAKIDAIDVNGKPNLYIADICRKFAMKKPANVEDVAAIIKLEMLKHNEYVREVRQ